MDKLFPFLPTIGFTVAALVFTYLAYLTWHEESSFYRIAAAMFWLAAVVSLFNRLRDKSNAAGEHETDKKKD